MDFDDGELIPISALQHYVFCPRQCALIHLERQWSDNRLTVAGRIFHERVDRRESKTSGNIHTAGGLKLFSRKLGVTGVADMVEFHRREREFNADGAKIAVKLNGLADCWSPLPVEYKNGQPKADASDRVQLCAQAMCIEEMLCVSIGEGALFYGRSRRRHKLEFTEELRAMTAQVAAAVRDMLGGGITPEGEYGKRCEACSMLEVCRPSQNAVKSAKSWLTREIDTVKM